MGFGYWSDASSHMLRRFCEQPRSLSVKEKRACNARSSNRGGAMGSSSLSRIPTECTHIHENSWFLSSFERVIGKYVTNDVVVAESTPKFFWSCRRARNENSRPFCRRSPRPEPRRTAQDNTPPGPLFYARLPRREVYDSNRNIRVRTDTSR